MNTWVGLLDCNNFFVSCERLFRPDIKHKPVVVLSSNDGCVVARSQEIKDMGVPMGVPYFKIKDILKTSHTTIFSGNHVLYRDISRRVFKAMREVLDDIEQYSIDEAFFVIESENPESVAQVVKDKVEAMVGVPVSVGVARSKTLAKLANDVAKKSTGTYWLTDSAAKEKREVTELHQVWGIGSRLSRTFRAHDLETVADLVSLEDRQIQQLFGVVGLRLKAELLGERVFMKGEVSEPRKSLMSSRTLADATTERSVLEAALAHHVNHVAEQLRRQKLRAGYMKIYISPSRFSDFALQNAAGELVFDEPTNVTSEMLKQANKLLSAIYTADVPYKRVGVLTADLVPESVLQNSLFEEPDREKNEVLQDAIDEINERAGTGKVRIGLLGTDTSWKARSELRSPDYTTNWKDLATVKA